MSQAIFFIMGFIIGMFGVVGLYEYAVYQGLIKDRSQNE